MASEQIQIGTGGNVHKNAPGGAIAQSGLIIAVFFMFVTTAFVANVVVRDDDTGFGPIIRSTRITKLHYLFGPLHRRLAGPRFAFLVVPLGLWIGIVDALGRPGDARAEPAGRLSLRLPGFRPPDSAADGGDVLRARRPSPGR